MKEEYGICNDCEERLPVEELYEFEGALYCEDCLDEDTEICTCCGQRIWNSDNAGTDSLPLCSSCYENYYTSCEYCGTLIPAENAYYDENDYDGYPYCRECFDRYIKTRGIHDYYYKPEPVFYGDGPRYMGVELEIDDGGEDRDNAEELQRIANNGAERIYCKHDGSLDDGFEIVTHPMTLDYHLYEMPWENLMKEAVHMGYVSHQAGTCGLHVHVSRRAFGETEEQQERCIARVLYFFEKHWEELLKFSRRTQSQLNQWAARYGYCEYPSEVLENAKKGNFGRYTCVNLTNYATIEFRIFRGTLKYNTLIATLQLVDKICDVAIHLSDSEIQELSWTTFTAGCRQPELVQYLKERRLYVNEPVETQEEV